MPEKRTEEVKAEAEQRNAAKQGSDYEARKGSAAADAKGAEKIMSVEDISSRTTEADKRENLTTRFGNLSEKTILIIMLVAWPLSVSALSLVMFLGALAFTDAAPLSAGIVGASIVVGHAIGAIVLNYFNARQEVARRAESLQSTIDDDLARLKSLRRRLLEY